MNNQKVIALIKNSEFYVRMKYIDIHYYFIKEVEFCKLIYLNYILTNNIVINRLTKSLLTLKFTYFMNLMSLISQWKTLWSNDMTLEFKTQEASVWIESEKWHIFLYEWRKCASIFYLTVTETGWESVSNFQPCFIILVVSEPYRGFGNMRSLLGGLGQTVCYG